MSILILAKATPAAPTSFSVDFTVLGNQSPMLTSQFLHGQADGTSWKNFQISGGRACAAAASSDSPPPYNDAVAILKASAFTPSANQYAERVVHLTNGYDPVGQTHEGGLFLRFSLSSGSAAGYEWYWSASNASEVVKWNGALNSFTPLSTTGSGPSSRPAHGDVQRFEITGTTLTCKINKGSGFVTVFTASDPDFASGQPGLQHYATSGATLASYGSQSFTCGNL